MAKIKTLTELDTNDLLKVLEGNTRKVSNLNYKNDVLDFLSTYQIENGDNGIVFNLIYEVYRKWSNKPLGNRAFCYELRKLLPYLPYGNNNLYMVNKPRDFFLQKTLSKKLNKTKSKSWFKHFEVFIQKYDLKSGSFYIKDIVLYNLYDKSIYESNKKARLSVSNFVKFCRLFFFKPKFIKGHEWFGVNNNVIEHLSSDLLELMKK
jgi:hypothetical protein